MHILHAKHILVKVDKTPSSMLLSYQQNAIVIVNYGKMSNIFWTKCYQHTLPTDDREKSICQFYIRETKRHKEMSHQYRKEGHSPILFLRLYKNIIFLKSWKYFQCLNTQYLYLQIYVYLTNCIPEKIFTMLTCNVV